AISGRSAQARCALRREWKSRNRWRSFFRNRSRTARVERYYGREVARKTAYNMEYQGEGWMNPDSNQTYATSPVSTPEHPLCTVCGMDVDPKVAPKSVFKGTTYYFCSEDDKETFDAAPENFVTAIAPR